MSSERTSAKLLRTSAGDRYFDYCLEPYTPRRPPEGKLRSENLLWHALEVAGIRAQAAPVLEALRGSLGRDMVVWGAKFDGRELFFELYVYDPRREEAGARYQALQATLAPVLPLTPEVPAHVDPMMVSIDLDARVLAKGRLDETNLYLTGSTRHEGRSYLASRPDRDGATSLELRNLYRFLDPKREIETLLPLVRASAHLDFGPREALAQVLLPELYACKRVCVAHKRDRDGVYFSGIDVDQLLFALRRFGWPSSMVDFVVSNAADLDHLYFDVGVDSVQEDGRITHPKTSFYGTI